MKHDLSKRSIYDIYNTYDKALIDITIRRFSSEKSNFKLLIRHFGKQFDGTGVTEKLSYMELSRLDQILMRFDDFLKLLVLLKGKGKNLSEIKQLSQQLSDVEALELYSRLRKNDSKVEVPRTFLKSLNLILQENRISEKKLEDAIDYHDNLDEKIAFKYYYGLGVNKLGIDKIASLLKLDKQSVEQAIIRVERDLPNLCSKVRKELHFSSTGTNSAKTLQRQQKSLINYVAEKNSTQEELEKINNRISLLAKYIQESKDSRFIVLTEFFGVNLDQKFLSVVRTYQKSEFYNLIRVIKTYMDMDDDKFAEILFIPEKTYIANFPNITCNIKDFELNDTAKRLQELAKKNTKLYDVLQKLYGKNLDQERASSWNLSTKQKRMLKQFFERASLEMEQAPTKRRKSKKLTESIKDYFYEYFDTEKLQISIDELKEIIITLIPDQIRHFPKLHECIVSYYGDNLMLSKKIELITEKDCARLKKYVLVYENKIEKYLECKRKQAEQTNGINVPSRLNSYFIDYFKDLDIEKDDLEALISIILPIMERRFPATHSEAIKIYGTYLNESASDETLNFALQKQFDSYITRSRELIIKVYDENKQYLKRHFYEYFTDLNSSFEEIYTLFGKINSDKNLKTHRKFELLTDIYGETLTSVAKFRVLTPQEKRDLKSSIAYLRNYLTNNPNDKVQNNDHKSYEVKKYFSEYFVELKSAFPENEWDELWSEAIRKQDSRSPVASNLVRKIYGQNLDESASTKFLNSRDTTAFIAYFTGVKNKVLKIHQDREQNLLNKKTHSLMNYIPKDIKERFSEEELSERVAKIIAFCENIRPTQYKRLRDVFGTDYKGKVETLSGDSKTYKAISVFRQDIINLIDLNFDKVRTRKRYKKNRTVFDLISPDILNNSSKDELLEKISIITTYGEIKKPNTYSRIRSIFGSNHDEETTEYQPGQNDYMAIFTFKKDLNNLLHLSVDELRSSLKVFKVDICEALKQVNNMTRVNLDAIKETLRANKTTDEALVQRIYEIFGEDITQEIFFVSLNKKDLQTIKALGKLIAKPNKTKISSKKEVKAKTILGMLCDSEMTEEELKILKDTIEFYIEKNLKDDNADSNIAIFAKSYRENASLDDINDKSIKKSLQKILKDIKNNYDYTKNRYSYMKKIYMNQDLEDMDDYLDTVILQYTKVTNSPEKVSEILGITLEEVLAIYLRHIEYFDLNNLLIYVASNIPQCLYFIFSSSTIQDLLLPLTTAEKEYLYLKLVSISNSFMTDEVIAEIMGLKTRDLTRYKIMTKSEEVNRLNLVYKIHQSGGLD